MKKSGFTSAQRMIVIGIIIIVAAIIALQFPIVSSGQKIFDHILITQEYGSSVFMIEGRDLQRITQEGRIVTAVDPCYVNGELTAIVVKTRLSSPDSTSH